MIFFMKKTEKIFGKEPDNIVDTLFYRFSRNPMYLGVVTLIFGLGILLESLSVILWAFISFIIFHFVVLTLEEPHLREKFGVQYELYCKKTPRWIGILHFRKKRP